MTDPPGSDQIGKEGGLNDVSEHGTAATDHPRDRLRHLQRLSAELADARTPEGAVAATVEHGIDVFAADRAVVALLDGSREWFEMAAINGYPDELLTNWSRFPNDGSSPLSAALRGGQAVVLLSGAEMVAQFPAMAGTERSQTLISLQMGQDVGGLALGYDRSWSPDEDELEFMQLVARQCGDAVRRGMLLAERRDREQALAFLAEASQAMASSLDYRSTLAQVARLAVPILADCCVVDVIEPSGVHQLALVHRDKQRERAAEQLERAYPADPDDPHSVVGRVMRSRETFVHSFSSDDELRTIARDEQHLATLLRLAPRSLIITPLLAHGRTLGALTFLSDVSGRRYGPADVATAQGLADRAALAIDNARLYEAQSRVVGDLQQNLLPAQLPRIDGLELAAAYRPAGEGYQVGGDFYDVWSISDESYALSIGDVSGKGPAAAGLTALVRQTIRVASLYELLPSRALERANDELRRDASDRFCTAAVARIDRVRGGIELTISLAGHPPPLRRGPDGVETLGAAGTLLGVYERLELHNVTQRLQPGDLVLFYTDGVTERRRDGEQFGEQRLADVLSGFDHGGSACELLRAVERALAEFVPDAQDDVAMLALRVP